MSGVTVATTIAFDLARLDAPLCQAILRRRHRQVAGPHASFHQMALA